MTRLEDEVKGLMVDVPDHHGFEHAVEVVRLSKLIASLEGWNNYEFVSFAGYLHDLRKYDSYELRIRKIPVNWGRRGSEVNAVEILRKHRKQVYPAKDIESPEEEDRLYWGAFRTYRDILEAVKYSSKLPDSQKPVRTTTQILRDADRLSRAGVEGLMSIFEANRDYKVPFYNEGEEIIRAKDAPIIPFDQIKSCVTDVISCTGDWEKIMETSTGKRLMPLFNKINHRFLKVFSHNKEILDYDIWIGWLNQFILQYPQTREYVNTFIDIGLAEEYLTTRCILESWSLWKLTGNSFRKYLNSR